MPAWFWALTGLAGVKILVGLAGLVILVDREGGSGPIDALRIANLVLLSIAGTILLFGTRRDDRASYLGGVFVLGASSPASAPLSTLTETYPGLPAGIFDLLDHLNPDAFIPLLLWLFFRQFPRSPVSAFERAPPRVALKVSAVAGTTLFGIHAFAPFAAPELHNVIQGAASRSLFWAVVAALGLPALAYGLWQMRRAPRTEARRMRLLFAGLILGAGPLFAAFFLAAVIPELGRAMRDPHDRWGLSIILRSLPLVIPVATVYAVGVHHVLDVRLVVRKAVRYALARYTVLGLVAIPFIAGLVHLFRHRAEPMAASLTGNRALALISLLALGLLLLKGRGGVLESIDRHFFREQFDARRILMELVERSHSVDNIGGLAEIVRAQLDQALHLERVSVFFLERSAGCLRCPDGGARDIPTSYLLVRILAGSSESLDIDFENQNSTLYRLPSQEQEILADWAFHLLTPLKGSGGELVGILGLGAKRSELGFSTEDRILLEAVATSGAVGFERLATADLPSAKGEPSSVAETASIEELAGECRACGKVYSWSASRCHQCNSELEPLRLPLTLMKKYLLESRLGAGSMGVVYLARDLALGRPLALKTLPRLSPELSLRLRREARAMAAIAHPNLALIYGVEAWRGMPVLLLEYLGGGTLARRLENSRLHVAEVVALGIALSNVLERAHAHGVLHRDIKPSNIAYTADGIPKLLDFGLAKILAEVHGDADESIAISASTLVRTKSSFREPLTQGRFVGTPAYMSPEAVLGRAPRPSFDLWSEAVVLLEALAGFNPFQRATRSTTLERIIQKEALSTEEIVPDCPLQLAQVLDRALDPDSRNRPANARVFRENLERVSADLAV